MFEQDNVWENTYLYTLFIANNLFHHKKVEKEKRNILITFILMINKVYKLLFKFTYR